MTAPRSLDPLRHFSELLVPGDHGGFLGQRGGHLFEIELRRGELLEQRLAAHARFLHPKADLRQRGTRRIGNGLRLLARNVLFANLRIRVFDRAARIAQLPLDRESLFEESLQLRLEFGVWSFAIGQLTLEVRTAGFQLARLLVRALEARAQGCQRRALGLDPDRYLLRRVHLFRMALAGCRNAGAQRVAFALEPGPALLQRLLPFQR